MVLAVFIYKNSGNIKDYRIRIIEPDLDNLGCLLQLRNEKEKRRVASPPSYIPAYAAQSQ